MKKITAVNQSLDASHNPETVIYVIGIDEWGDRIVREYSIYNLPKYVKKFMATHRCEVQSMNYKGIYTWQRAWYQA